MKYLKVSLILSLFLIFCVGCTNETKQIKLSLEDSLGIAELTVPLDLEEVGYFVEYENEVTYKSKEYYSYNVINNNNELLESKIFIDVISGISYIYMNNELVLPENDEVFGVEYVDWDGSYSKLIEDPLSNNYSNLEIERYKNGLNLKFDSYYGRGSVKANYFITLKDRRDTNLYEMESGEQFQIRYNNDGSITVITYTGIEETQLMMNGDFVKIEE